jgi:hypothetical protein
MKIVLTNFKNFLKLLLINLIIKIPEETSGAIEIAGINIEGIDEFLQRLLLVEEQSILYGDKFVIKGANLQNSAQSNNSREPIIMISDPFNTSSWFSFGKK